MLLGLRTVVYPAPDLAAAKEWWSAVLGVQPYFDEPFFVGFNPGGYELGLDPAADPEAGPQTYWGVRSIDAAAARLTELGAVPVDAIADVGDGIRLGTFRAPDGSILGLIENPVFTVTAATAPESDGPGR
ncbi:VOC family protein [Leifsonia sp. NPDC058292]|uniref:VOC family protein n=1 Tax=Leifsonia sp. NPDC058292 TaxID=3346428 RepID=UPI0036DE1CB6